MTTIIMNHSILSNEDLATMAHEAVECNDMEGGLWAIHIDQYAMFDCSFMARDYKAGHHNAIVNVQIHQVASTKEEFDPYGGAATARAEERLKARLSSVRGQMEAIEEEAYRACNPDWRKGEWYELQDAEQAILSKLGAEPKEPEEATEAPAAHGKEGI
jgi:hypothetical protein